MNLRDIKVNPDNPRLIKDDKFKKLVASIKDFPKMMELRPIVVDDTMTILGGNMRFRALQSLGYTELEDSWVKIADKLTDAEKKRFIVEDNLPFGEWDWDILANNFEIKDLLDWGFSEEDLKIKQDIEEDEVPEVSDEPAISKLGEVYQLGRHRLMCGDSTKIEDVEKLMDGQRADLLLTDPPYGVAYIGKTDKSLTIDNDAKTPQQMHDFWVLAFSNMNAVSKSGCSYYCCSSQGGEMMMMMMMSLFDSGFLVKQQIIWKKNCIVMGHSDYQFQHEPLFYGWKKDGSHQFYGDRTQSSVWEINKPNASREHPTMKPVELFIRPIKNSSKSDDIVLDLFGGSGTTIIACEQLGRNGYVAEIDPKFCDVIRKRYAKFIGKENEWQTITPIVKQ